MKNGSNVIIFIYTAQVFLTCSNLSYLSLCLTYVYTICIEIIITVDYIPIKLKPKLARASISVAFGEDIAIFPSFQFQIIMTVHF
jgi:hypothetical protein